MRFFVLPEMSSVFESEGIKTEIDRMHIGDRFVTTCSIYIDTNSPLVYNIFKILIEYELPFVVYSDDYSIIQIYRFVCEKQSIYTALDLYNIKLNAHEKEKLKLASLMGIT